jgi:hypothetical protein
MTKRAAQNCASRTAAALMQWLTRRRQTRTMPIRSDPLTVPG